MSVRTLFFIVTSLATLTLLLPLWQAAREYPVLSEAQKFFAAYVGVGFVTDAAMFVLGRLGHNNLWLTHLVIPIQTMLIVLAFAAWQVDQRVGKWLRRGAPFVLIFWIPAIAGWESTTNFSTVSSSIQATLCLAVAAFTVVRRSFDDHLTIRNQSWFWVGLGVMLYFATFALLEPLGHYLLRLSPVTVVAVFTVRSAFQLLANLLYYQGMRCPLSPPHSWPSTSPPPRWPSSSSSPLAPP